MAEQDAASAKRGIREILQRHQGEDNAISAGDIGEEVGIQEGDTHSRVRGIISELLVEGFPVGATTQGYFLITSRKELDRYVGGLYGRIRKIDRRIDAVIDAFGGPEDDDI